MGSAVILVLLGNLADTVRYLKADPRNANIIDEMAGVVVRAKDDLGRVEIPKA